VNKRDRNRDRNTAKKKLEDYQRDAFIASAEGPGNERLKEFLRDPAAQAVIAAAGKMFEQHPGKTIIVTSGPHPTRTDMVRYAIAVEGTKLPSEWTEILRLVAPSPGEKPGLGTMFVVHDEGCPVGREPGVHEDRCVCKPERTIESHESEPS
jgi:hypothetical protein